MYKTLVNSTFLLLGMISISGHVFADQDTIKEDCEAEVQAYGLTDAEEIQQALNDCIVNKTPDSQSEQDSSPSNEGSQE